MDWLNRSTMDIQGSVLRAGECQKLAKIRFENEERWYTGETNACTTELQQRWDANPRSLEDNGHTLLLQLQHDIWIISWRKVLLN